MMLMHTTSVSLPLSSSRMIRPLPLLDLLKLLTLMLRVEIRCRTQLCSWFKLMQERCNVCVAHEANTESLDAVVDVLFQLFSRHRHRDVTRAEMYGRRMVCSPRARSHHHPETLDCHYSHTHFYTYTVSPYPDNGYYGRLLIQRGRRLYSNETRDVLEICSVLEVCRRVRRWYRLF
jgi:hypothetical protein